jgi:phage terminase large subunit GpA-like protein
MIWREAGLSCLQPRPRVSLPEWADAHLYITSGPEAGRWRTSRTPYLRGPMEAVSDPKIEQIVIMAAAQVGKTSLLLAAVGYYVAQDPSSILVVQSTGGAAHSFSKERLEPAFAASPTLRPLLSEPERARDSTVLVKLFPGGQLSMAWATSPVALASRPIRVVLGDELDLWDESDTGGDGDPWAAAVTRTSTYGHRRKVVAVSTPSIEGRSRIAALYLDSDQRHYLVPCPHCAHVQSLLWRNLEYKRDGIVDLDSIRYVCKACSGEIQEHHKPEMLARGEWVAQNPGHATAGFHVSGLLSPWMTWRELVTLWLRAVETRDEAAKRAFYNLRLGEVWRERAERITVEALEKKREHYDAELPAGTLFITAGVDTQDDRLEVFVVGWGEHRESWAIEYAKLHGNTDDLGPLGPWVALDQFLARAWSKGDGASMTLACAFVDAGGHRTSIVHRWCAERDARRIYACYGVGGEKPICGKGTTTTLRSWKFPVGSDTAKSTIHSRFALDTPGPGYVHFPDDTERGFDGEFFRGLLSERLDVTRGKRQWKRDHRRNEPLDTFAYATAAMEFVVSQNPALLIPGTAPAATTAPKRRVISRGVQW